MASVDQVKNTSMYEGRIKDRPVIVAKRFHGRFAIRHLRRPDAGDYLHRASARGRWINRSKRLERPEFAHGDVGPKPDCRLQSAADTAALQRHRQPRKHSGLFCFARTRFLEES